MWVMVVFLLYFSLHTAVVLLRGNPIAKPSYGTFEALLLNFVLVPAYVTTFRNWLTPALLKRFLVYFCLGCLLINVYILFALTGTKLFSAPVETINWIYNTRFLENREVFGNTFWLEIQAMMLGVAAIISYIFLVKEKQTGMRIIYVFMFLALLVFLSFTVTKAAILGFLAGFFVLNVYLFRKFSSRMRYRLVAILLISLCGFILLADVAKYEERVQQVKDEIESVKKGEYDGRGATIIPRVAFIRESYKHFDEFGLWGLGVCTKHRVKAWYEASDMNIAHFNNVNNAFLQYWITAGILGLGVMLFLFIAPIYRMIRRKKFSYLILAMLLVFFVVSNTCVTLSWANSRLLMLLFLAMFCFYSDMFADLEKFSDESSTL